MRFSRINRYLLLLAVLFVLAVLRRADFPGEEMVPRVFRATVHQPLLEPAASAAHGEAVRLVELESELTAARLEVRRLKEQLEQTHELERFFGKLRWDVQPVAVPAWVFLAESDDYRRVFRIDRGQADGVRPGLAVVTGKALLGIVTVVNREDSLVRRVDDPSFRLEVEIQTAAEVVRGVARGDGARGLDIAYVPRTGSLKPGNPVFTTGYHDDIPAGLVVGAVASVDDLDQDGIHEVTVTPTAALGRWAQVHILKTPLRRSLDR